VRIFPTIVTLKRENGERERGESKEKKSHAEKLIRVGL